ncbi:hypothetical protein GSI_12691 [Ganoderma sinense ZZ0214-1]|uniref:Uncharacterized protein n=1 Tax=Ganoderma sinense ZZ0214-1 TaxID=1077348 RepID=A0A2G8RTF6_9APHY|nr:hypothetical protein GSI_12691 [Ganoderma sinense ZZ0214-1]
MAGSHATTFLHLPVELRRMIKDSVDPSDLRTHVCLYLAHSSCSALYHDSLGQKRFWRRLCWNCGIGQLPDEDDEFLDDDDWRQIALECVHRCGFNCTLPHCGESLLEYNRMRMRENGRFVGLFTPLRVYEDYRADDGKARFDIHPALYHVDFCATKESPGFFPHPVEHDAHFRWHPNPPTKAEARGLINVDPKKRAYVGQHPLAARSFATATPVSNVALFKFVGSGTITDIDLDRAVTVFDVLSAIHKDLDTDLSVRDVRSHLGFGFSGHLQCVAQEKWGVEEAFDNLQSARDVLRLCPIKEMTVEELTDDGPAVFFELY